MQVSPPTNSNAVQPYLEGLNDAQQKAVETLDGPVLMLAGAGTGKTRALTTRLGHILLTGRAMPANILAVTFTNKAAREMKDRVAALLGRPSVEGWWLGTFHSLAARILRDHAEVIGLKRHFTILDSDDQKRLLKQILAAEGIEERTWPVRALHNMIERWKDRGYTPEKVPASDGGDFAGGRAVALYKMYADRLIELNACDFGDLILHNLTIFQARADIIASYRRQFRYILVDEYQDTNVAQYLWLRWLTDPETRNICCVGDDDQSIYGWRGAEVGNILRFETDYPGAVIIRLERNYRSTPHILSAASGIIAHNQKRLGKTLWTDVRQGEKVIIRGLWDGESEARWVGEEIEALHRSGTSLSQMAVLVRTSAQTREFEERFATLAIPYRVIGGPRFYERMEIRDALAYLRLVNSTDDDLAFERILNKPKRGLGDASLKALQMHRRQMGGSLFQAAQSLIATDELRPQTRRALERLTGDFQRWREEAKSRPHAELAESILDESGYTGMWQKDTSIESEGRLENLKELINALDEFESLSGFLEHVSLVMETFAEAGTDQVSLMTLHGAKGLEFDSVFLAGWEEGLLPNQRALDDGGFKSLEEERRLAYVGLTRAKCRAFISFAANRRLHGNWLAAIPSRFISELPAESIEIISDTGLYGAGQANRPYTREMSATDTQARESPGMRRARAYQHDSAGDEGGGPILEGQAQSVFDTAADVFSKQMRVFHRKFGYGTVTGVEGDRITVAFDKAGVKKVVASYIVAANKAV